jgi:DNA-binding LytR/AlgR family response regulator
MNSKLSCLIVDDDDISVRMIMELINKTDVLDLKGTCSSSLDAAKFLKDIPIDILFLDVEMPTMNGFELVQVLEKKPQIILISGSENYAINAFDLNATDFLIKGRFNYARFLIAVNKAEYNIERESVEKPAIPDNKNFFIKSDSMLVNFDLKDILWVEANGDYVIINTSTKEHKILAKLKNIEEKLPSNDFVRVHRSFIVRIDKIRNIDNANLLIGNHIIPISNSYRNSLLEKISTI